MKVPAGLQHSPHTHLPACGKHLTIPSVLLRYCKYIVEHLGFLTNSLSSSSSVAPAWINLLWQKLLSVGTQRARSPLPQATHAEEWHLCVFCAFTHQGSSGDWVRSFRGESRDSVSPTFNLHTPSKGERYLWSSLLLRYWLPAARPAVFCRMHWGRVGCSEQRFSNRYSIGLSLIFAKLPQNHSNVIWFWNNLNFSASQTIVYFLWVVNSAFAFHFSSGISTLRNRFTDNYLFSLKTLNNNSRYLKCRFSEVLYKQICFSRDFFHLCMYLPTVCPLYTHTISITTLMLLDLRYKT